MASTVSDGVEEIKIIGKKLKKNQIAIDIIGIGDVSQDQRDKLNALLEAVNQQDNSSIKIVEP